jgi:hypothetical protein
MEGEPKPRQNLESPRFRSFAEVLEQVSREEDAELDRLENLERMMQSGESSDLPSEPQI